MKIKAVCSCGKKFLAKAELAGKRVSCPICGRAFIVPDLPPPAAQPLGDLLDEIGPLDASLEQTTGVLAPSRRRRSSNGGMWIVLGLAGVGLAGLVVVVIVIAMVGGSARKGPDTTQDTDTTQDIDTTQDTNTLSLSPSGANSDDWYTYTSTLGQCSISMPREPEQKGRYGERVVVTTASGFCSLAVRKLLKETSDVDAELDSRVATTLKGVRGEVKESRSISLQGYRGRELTYETTVAGKRLQGRCRHYVLRGRAYELLFCSAKDNYSKTDERRFFDSFTLLEPGEALHEPAGSIAGTSSSATHAKSALPDSPRDVFLPDDLHGVGAAFSASGDRLLVACLGGAIVLYDTHTWKPLPTKGLVDPKRGEQSPANFFSSTVDLFGIAFSPDGKRALCWGNSPIAQEWDLQSGRTLREFRHETIVVLAGYSPDGRLIVTAPDGKTTPHTISNAEKAGIKPRDMKEAWRIWDVNSGKELGRCAPPLGDPSDLQFSPEGDRLYLMSTDSVACADPVTGDDIWRFKWQSNRRSIALDPNRERAVLFVDQRMWICDLTTGKILHRLNNQPRLSTIKGTATISPNGRWAAIVSRTGPMQLWDLRRRVLAKELKRSGVDVSFEEVSVETRSVESRVLSALEPPLGFRAASRVAFHPGGTYGLAMNGRRIRIFDMPGPMEIVRDRPRVVPDPPEQVWQADKVRKVLAFASPRKSGGSLAFSPDGDWIALSLELGSNIDIKTTTYGKIFVFDANDGQPFRIRPFAAHRAQILSLGVSGDGKTLITTDDDGSVFLWDPATGKLVASLEGHQRAVPRGALSFDGKLALTADGRTTPGPHNLILWDVATAQPSHRLQGHQHPVLAVEFLDERRAVSVDMYNAALWDLETGKLSGSTIVGEGISNAIQGATFSADGTRLLACSSGHVRLWDLTSGRVISEIVRKNSTPMTPALSHDGRLGVFWDMTELILHDFQNGRDLDRTQMVKPRVVFSRDGSQFATYKSGFFMLWAVPELEPSGPESTSRD